MLAEKFILLLDTLKCSGHADGGPRVISTSQHVPMQLPNAKCGTPEASGQ